MALYNKPFAVDTVRRMAQLPHPTIQKFGVINVVVVGASRRFLAQVTRHQNEVKFMSASLQYSDYTDSAAFAVPYNVLARGEGEIRTYNATCQNELRQYEAAVGLGLDHDSAGYMMPQGLRNVLIISATPYQWKHMISQRTCRRNTDETRIVFLKIWEELALLAPALFSIETTGPFCCKGACMEGKMSCGKPFYLNPSEALRADYPLLFKEDNDAD
jgi:thymidylate synthase (FAD)